MIILSTYNDKEKSRMRRLRLLKSIIKFNSTSFCGIVALHDHKGCLAVNWSKNPESEEREAISDIWQKVFCENGDMVDHFVNGIKITNNVFGLSPFEQKNKQSKQATATINSTIYLANDICRGIKDIANELGITKRRAYYLLQSGIIPAGKEGRIWIASKSKLREFYTSLTSGHISP